MGNRDLTKVYRQRYPVKYAWAWDLRGMGYERIFLDASCLVYPRLRWISRRLCSVEDVVGDLIHQIRILRRVGLAVILAFDGTKVDPHKRYRSGRAPPARRGRRGRPAAYGKVVAGLKAEAARLAGEKDPDFADRGVQVEVAPQASQADFLWRPFLEDDACIVFTSDSDAMLASHKGTVCPKLTLGWSVKDEWMLLELVDLSLIFPGGYNDWLVRAVYIAASGNDYVMGILSGQGCPPMTCLALLRLYEQHQGDGDGASLERLLKCVEDIAAGQHDRCLPMLGGRERWAFSTWERLFRESIDLLMHHAVPLSVHHVRKEPEAVLSSAAYQAAARVLAKSRNTFWEARHEERRAAQALSAEARKRRRAAARKRRRAAARKRRTAAGEDFMAWLKLEEREDASTYPHDAASTMGLKGGEAEGRALASAVEAAADLSSPPTAHGGWRTEEDDVILAGLAVGLPAARIAELLVGRDGAAVRLRAPIAKRRASTSALAAPEGGGEGAAAGPSAAPAGGGGQAAAATKRKSWTEEEEQIFVAAHRQLGGNNWTAIAEKLPDRSAEDINNHWKATQKRKSRTPRDKSEPTILRGYMEAENHIKKKKKA